MNQKSKKSTMKTKPHKTLVLKLIECGGGGVGDDSYIHHTHTQTHTHQPYAICSIPFPWLVTMDASMRIFVCILHALGTWNLKLELKLYLCMCALAVCNICENLFQHIFCRFRLFASLCSNRCYFVFISFMFLNQFLFFSTHFLLSFLLVVSDHEIIHHFKSHHHG